MKRSQINNSIEAEALKIKIKTLKKIFGMPDNNLQIWEIEAYK